MKRSLPPLPSPDQKNRRHQVRAGGFLVPWGAAPFPAPRRPGGGRRAIWAREGRRLHAFSPPCFVEVGAGRRWAGGAAKRRPRHRPSAENGGRGGAAGRSSACGGVATAGAAARVEDDHQNRNLPLGPPSNYITGKRMSKMRHRSLNFLRCVVPVHRLLKYVIPVHKLLMGL